MKKICIFFVFISIGSVLFAETYGQLLSRVELVDTRTVELFNEPVRTEHDYYLLAGRISGAAGWLSERYDDLINNFSLTWSRNQINEYRERSDFWNKINDEFNNWAYDQEIQRLQDVIDGKGDNPELQDLLHTLSNGQFRALSNLNNEGSRP